MTEKKPVSADKKLTALALYTMARQHATEAQRYEEALHKLMGPADDRLDHFSDAIWGDGRRTFEKAFELEGFIVRDEPSTA